MCSASLSIVEKGAAKQIDNRLKSTSILRCDNRLRSTWIVDIEKWKVTFEKAPGYREVTSDFWNLWTYYLLYWTGSKLAIIWRHKHKHEQATVNLWRLILQDHKREVKLALVPCGLRQKRSVTFFIYMCSLTKLSTFDISKCAHDRLTAI